MAEQVYCPDCGYETLKFDPEETLFCPYCYKEQTSEFKKLGSTETQKVVTQAGPELLEDPRDV